MKICLINSSYEGVDSPFEKYDEFPDPNRYISKERHEFVTRYVTKANAKAEIDEICKEDFDLFMNYMWGIESDDVAGVEATRYLESKGVIILTNPSTFLAKNKLDLQKAAKKCGLRIPGDTPGKYPKIVKYADGYGSLNLDENSICYTEEDVIKRVAMMQKDNTTFGILVQDYIIGKECSAIVVEMGREVVALTPLQYVFPENTPDNEAFLTWYNKFEAVDKGIIKYAFVEEEPHKANLQSAAVEAFKALGVSGGGGWARVDMRLEESTGHVYVIEVNCIPVVFYPKGNTLGDDMVVEEKFPGGQAAFFDMLLATKQMQLGWHNAQNKHIAAVYDNFAPAYHAVWGESALCSIQKFFSANYDFSGTVLDVACGTGAMGQVLHEQGIQAEVIGIDLSPCMLEAPNIKEYYKEVRVGPMQELIMGAGEHDHITCFGALHFLDTVHLNAVLARMFMLARKSVTFEIDDLDEAYIQEIKQKHGDLTFNANHVQAVEEFGIPKGWKRVYNERQFLYSSPTTKTDVYGYAMRQVLKIDGSSHPSGTVNPQIHRMADDNETPAEGEVVESLIQGRARRSTAGRHLSALLNAEADDELALLFEEVDDDNEFSIAEEEAGEEDDMALDSSSDDDEDQGPNVRGDDFEGEKEIEKQAKADRQKRRAREDLRLKLARKKVKIDPSAVSTVPAPRPKKKSERISWLPTVEDGPTRSSSRRQTMQNKQLTHARLKDSEEKRIRLIATMEEAAKRKAHLKPKKMTQADRLAEAERVERLNSKSLSRWEEMEKRKAEERRAKIEALQNRRLEGPVISYWSGIATWVNGRLTRVGKVDITPKPEKEETTRKKSKKTEKEEKGTTEKPAQKAEETIAVTQDEGTEKATTTSEPTKTTSAPENSTLPEGSAATAESTKPIPQVESTPVPVEANTAKAPDSELPKIETDAPKEPVEVESKTTGEAPQENETAAAGLKTPVEAPKDPTQAAAQVPEERPAPNPDQSKPEVPLSGVRPDDASKTTDAEASTNEKPSSESNVIPPATSSPAIQVPAAAPTQTGQLASTEQEQVAPEIHVDQPAFSSDGAPQHQIPAPPPVVEQTGRCLTILENFDEETAQSREFSIYFNSKKPPRLTKISSSLCVITSLPSRYRDTETGLPFANAYAYREIRRTVAQKSAWSPMLGCYVGPVGVAARGVPERFLNPDAPSETQQSEKKQGKDGEEGPASAAPAGNPEGGEMKTPGGGSNPPAPPTPTPVAAGGGDPMDIDKP
ncbi:hypothetical protein CFD26_106825 [Aspergillus turcosus]|uniref:Vps72/YL1 C-terminal domain-containing protein n=1 Tax=Aspergillus turcosus TaxID=1245748 RepID=A0A421DAQ9_9EURO|nr:hypothetical protein CFD26_106825 [Aspergillus turcosus]